MTLDDLIARLESAEEGSRYLDADIAAHLGGGQASHHCADQKRKGYGAGFWFTDENNTRAILSDHTHNASHYTTSLDAVRTLYIVQPDYIPNDPLKACAEALKARKALEDT